MSAGRQQIERTTYRNLAVVVKRWPGAPADFFTAEATGLATLAAAGAMRVPRVLALEPERLVLEDLGEGVQKERFWTIAGEGLAAQHALRNARFGFKRDGYCGPTPQSNAWTDDGWAFFAEHRLLPQARRALDGGHLPSDDVDAVERVCSRLRELIPPQRASLLHGDLWMGNLHCCADGSPALIDAGAVHYGWPESELAMLTLFGSPPDAFWRAYGAHAVVASDWRERAPVYNLYHLLNHLNLFGGSYRAGVREVLERFG
ncbi:fructosamine kinase family protein [Lysobacter auxotrophicus]|uniref:Fructosamine kinase family protein n=1 Tax=Lysobacter auxotrophicus TaxID=2992573 RepID=A0ABM8DB46_9GAMM|nr:fructosamine kinase family protein [Lysobacter auxotrophicus]BDU15794.1 fructosamine kinase family protein [Lysobacter auxotrophicus]